MTARRHRICRAALPGKGEVLIAEAGLDRSETLCLTLARRFFRLMGDPNSADRRQKVEAAAEAFGAAHGPEVAWAMSELLGLVRHNRRSTFVFSNPDCPGCARILTEHERRLMGALAAVRRARKSAAHVEAMLLCEGSPAETVLEGIAHLAALLPPPDTQERMSREWTEH